MTDENLKLTTLHQTSIEPSSSNDERIQRHSDGVVRWGSFLRTIGSAGAALSASVVLARKSYAQASCRSTVKFPKGDAALLRLTAAVELIEADLVQVNEYERRLEQEIRAFEEWQRNL